MSKEILKIDSSISITRNEKPPRTGSFEVTQDGKLIYSKFETGVFPTSLIIKSWL